MLTQNFRASAQSALIASIMAVSTFVLVIGPDPARYAAVAALLVLAPTALLAIRMGSVIAPEIDPQTLRSLDIAAAARVDQLLIASAWLGVAGAFLTGLAASVRFDVGGPELQIAAIAATAVLVLAASPVIAGLVRPLRTVTLSTAGVRLSPTRQIRWRDLQEVRLHTLGVNRLVLTLKPSSRDPGGPPQTVRLLLPAVIEPWVRTAALALVARHLGDSAAAD
jgi:hypothetical protein